MNHQYVVIMAGGSGSRLWPMSRQSSPKQFQKLVGEKTLIQDTYDRVRKIVPTNQIYVATIEQYRDLVTQQLPDMPVEHIFLEPAARNTAPAFGLIAYKLQKEDPQAIVATIASDHVVQNVNEFAATCKVSFEMVSQNKGYLGVVGINPDKPDINYGYIKMGDEYSVIRDKKIFKVESFVEKPNLKTATEYLRSWQYLWNASYFFWGVKDMTGWLEKHQAKMARGLKKIISLNAETDAREVAKLYKELPSEAIDTAIVEKLDKILVVPADLGWSDVGNWSSLYDVLSNSFDSLVVSKGHHVDHDSKNILVYAQDKMIATVGLKDVVIIDTQDAILVIDKNRAPDVKKLLDRIKVDGKHLYL